MFLCTHKSRRAAFGCASIVIALLMNLWAPSLAFAQTGHDDEHPPARALSATPAPGDAGLRPQAQCASDKCAGAAPGAASARVSAAAPRWRTRGSNSQLQLPRNLTLADVNADGVTDFLQYAGNRIFVYKSDYEQTGILHLYMGRPIKRVITGDFHGDGYDQVCAWTDDNALVCYGISTDRRQLWWWFTQGMFASDGEDTIVGDFDGDGRDDVLVYPRGGGAYRMYSIKNDFFFEPTPAFNQGNLAGVTAAGMQLRAGDFGGDGRMDLLVINPSRQLARYESVNDGTHNTFWWAFTSVSDFVGANDQVTTARVNDDWSDDVVVRNRTSGATRFHHLEWNDGHPPQVGGIPTGQINLDGDSIMAWGAMHDRNGETGADKRDDAFVYLLGANMLVRSDARWDGAGYTYWWAYTQFAPNNHAGWAANSAKPWLLLKCRFSDVSAQPRDAAFYQNLVFGTQGLSEYWRDISYGSWSLDGSVVVEAWQQMSITNSDWRALASRYDRAGKCLDAYSGNKSGFVNAITIVNAEGDAGNHSGRVLLTPDSSDMAWLAHETAHTLGWWTHSFDDTDRKNADWSAPGEYFDHWDIMSAMAVHQFTNAFGVASGPEMNAPLKTKAAFIPAHRMRRISAQEIAAGITLNLAAISHPEGSGPLMLRIGDDDNNYYTIEYRTKDAWDAGIPQPTVLVHRVTGGTTYLITQGGTERTVGTSGAFQLGNSWFGVGVNAMAAEGYTANITIGQSCVVKAGQVALYTGKNFTGMCVVKLLNAWNDAASIGLPNDSIASIALGPQTQATLCRDVDMGGICERFAAADADLSDNVVGINTVSSLRAGAMYQVFAPIMWR